MIRQPSFAAKCVKVGGLKEARDRNIGGSMFGCRGILLLDVCLWQSVFKNSFRATGGIFLSGRWTKISWRCWCVSARAYSRKDDSSGY
jgi:hypothetical protein